MKSGVSLVKDNYIGLVKGTKFLAEMRVLVGVPGEKTTRNPDQDEAGSPITNAALAYIHDNGAPEANIPARPFMLPGLKKVQTEIAQRLRTAGVSALNGNQDQAERRLEGIGLVAVSSIRATINEGVPPPLAPATIAGRQARGRTGTKPLIDTGQLRNSITYVIRKAKGR